MNLNKDEKVVSLPRKSKASYCPQIISLFAGCGGMDAGFHLEGYETVWANEFNQWAANSYEANLKGIQVDRRSILDIDPCNEKGIPDADLVIGGFPCQDFSMTWKRPGLNGARGGLYKEYLKFIKARRPKAFVAENVKGIISANQGEAIRQIVSDFASIEPGYTLSIKLYNFADYGVPQFRERVLIVGIRNDTGFDFHHPTPTHGPKVGKPYFTAGMALKEVERVPHNNEHMKIMPRTKEILRKIPEGGNFTSIPKNDPHYVKGMISHVYRRVNRNEPAKTLIASGGGGTWGYHYEEARALTNRERARLQSFPDDFKFVGSFGEIRRQIGNAVPPEGIRLLARNLKQLFIGGYKTVDLYQKSKDLNALPMKKRILIDYYETTFNQQKTSSA